MVASGSNSSNSDDGPFLCSPSSASFTMGTAVTEVGVGAASVVGVEGLQGS